MNCLEGAIIALLYSSSGSVSVLSRLLSTVCVKWRVFSKEQLIVTMFKRPGNIKGVTGFKKQAELYPYKCCKRSPTFLSFTFNRLSNSTVKVLTICDRTVVFVLTAR